MNDINSKKKVSFKYFLLLLGIILASIFIGRIGTAYIIGENPNLSLFFTFGITAIVSFILSFIIVSPRLKEIPLKRFLITVIPLSLMFTMIFGFILQKI
ncbi:MULTISPECIES: hypothetical protein [unclassified Bacillus (in: firmicutes)]|uniref:hypothetical protein n=1 Tax=unclassified Bacillus (in: firmicutes) TaxID=185979 RepID=UPI0038348BAE